MKNENTKILSDIDNTMEMNLLASKKVADSVDNLEPIMEGILVKTDELVKEAKKSTPIEIEINGAETTMYKGEKGDKGDEPTDERLIELIQPLIPEPKDGKDGTSVDKQEVIKDILEIVIPEIPSVEEIVAQIPVPKDGKDGMDADEIDVDEVVEKVIKKIPKPKNGKDGSPDTSKQVKEKLLKEGLSYSELKDAPDIEKIEQIARKTSSKTTSLVELDDVDYSGLTVTNGKYVLGGGSGGVTLAGEDYLSLTGQQITANPIDLDNLSATGTPSGSTFLRGDNTWATPAGSGDVSKVGTPVNNQVGVWTGDGTIEGDVDLTFDTATNTLGVGLVGLDGRVQVHAIKSDASDGLLIEASDGTDVGLLGVANTANVTWYGSHNFSTATQDTIAGFTGAGKTLGSLATATYPSLTELSYVKGVTSAVQTQLNAKGAGTVTSVGFTGGIVSVATATTTPAFTVAGTSGGIPYFSSSSAWATSAALAANALVIGGGAGVAPSTITTGTGVVTALGVNVGTSGAFVTNGGALGTPSSGTITNLTGTASININGTVGATTPTTGSFTTVTTSGNIELGDASDTTLSRVSAGVIAVEGVTVATSSNTLTLTNKTIGAGALTLAESASVALDPSLSADGTYSGITITGTAGTTLAFGDLCYLAAADSRWELCDADSSTTAGGVLMGFCVQAAASDGSATTILLSGNIRADAAFPALTVGAPVYASTTAGDIQTTQPSGTDDVIQVVGFALTADSIIVKISPDYITRT